MDKEQVWKSKRLGYISASELDDIVSSSGKVIDGNLAYIRKKRFERKHGYTLPVSCRAMEIGKEQEPYIVAWLRENYPSFNIIYSIEQEEIPFWKVNWAKFGASPDCFTDDESIVFECKTLVSNERIEFFADEYTSEEEKRKQVWKEHGNQIIGQFLSNKKVKEIWLVKYIYQQDDIMEDLDSPLAPWRGKVFKFKRDEIDLEPTKERIILFDNFIDSKENPSVLKDILGKKKDESKG